ncbi:MATE family efflux transporter [Emcibacter nanhaiensis]|uniref:Multidrug export protein MepA n=1 Tax=Emcibacter nanhaiensis TaxID=1505037 RepID=A0A501PCG9_9PROT|nr:MATE family efflux transporter [Emcibacter nanhaiensis]TPD57915.1 MATE family efflux transporter [Emcibacter nanhaiensis]
MSSDSFNNSFVRGPLGAVFAKTALPIIFVMSMNGLLTVVDAIFLGVYVGADALGAVTLMFPLYMLIVALATLVASGMSSIIARHLGAQHYEEARGVFAGAHGLALAVSAGFILLFLLLGDQVTLLAANGSASLAEMGHTYLAITVIASPVLFLLSINSDALRNEGRAGFMAAMSLLVSLVNIGFNYVLIVVFDLGVAGSAYGTVAAQLLALSIIFIFRLRGRTELRPNAFVQHRLTAHWRRILALGAPQSLNFLGMALGSTAILTALQMVAGSNYETTISAYGIISRVMTFTFLPLLGISQAMQSITGNNYGAGLWQRSNDSLRLAIMISFVYCLVSEIILVNLAGPIGRLFVDNTAVAGEVARIMPVMATMFFAAGPLIIIATYFQAIGDAGRAAVLGLAKPYLFALPLIFLLALTMGEKGIWMASPVAELLLLGLTTLILAGNARQQAFRWGLFRPEGEKSEVPANASSGSKGL